MSQLCLHIFRKPRFDGTVRGDDVFTAPPSSTDVRLVWHLIH